MKNKIIIMILALVLIGFIFVPKIKVFITGYAEKHENTRDFYTYTKALCTEDNFCQDYIIACENKQIQSITPVTGAVIQHSEDWQDPRPNDSDYLCE